MYDSGLSVPWGPDPLPLSHPRQMREEGRSQLRRMDDDVPPGGGGRGIQHAAKTVHNRLLIGHFFVKSTCNITNLQWATQQKKYFFCKTKQLSEIVFQFLGCIRDNDCQESSSSESACNECGPDFRCRPKTCTNLIQGVRNARVVFKGINRGDSAVVTCNKGFIIRTVSCYAAATSRMTRIQQCWVASSAFDLVLGSACCMNCVIHSVK